MASKVTCSNCGWSWNKSDSSKKDMYVCHQCGRDNSNKSEGWLDKYEEGGQVDKYKTLPEVVVKSSKKKTVFPQPKVDPAIFNNDDPKWKEQPYEPSQAVKDTKAVLTALQIAGNPLVRRYAGISNAVFDAGTAAKYLLDSQYKNAAIDAGEALVDLIPFNPSNLRKLNRSINAGVNSLKVGAYVDDFQDAFGSKIKGWLDKYEQGGMVLKQKTKDNYGKKPNVNNVQVSAPPGFVGMGSNIEGRDYSPAWGGKFEDGGYVPIAQKGLTFLETTSPKLPMGYIIPSNMPSTERASSVGGENGEPAYLIPEFKYGHPLKDPKGEFRNTGEHLGGPFKTYQEAEEWERDVRHPYVEKGQSIPTPIRRWGKDFEMGGSLPGSVGFTYARTAGSAPANGKYTKKTLASAQNGQEMSYYQNGLDFKTKGMKNGGWLDAYDVPQAQEGDVFPKREQSTPASESTSIMRNIPGEGLSTTATTGQRKGDVKLDADAMKRFKAAETKDKQKRIAERKSAIAAKDKGKPFTLPTGESKKYEDMDWREKAYVSGKSLESKGRANENDEAWYDEINPINWVTDMAGGLATAPYEARESNSNMPYLSAIATPLIEGALGFDPLGGAMKVPGRVAQSMESGVLSNTHKLNPYAFKPNESNWYRQIGDAGYQDAIKTGMIRGANEDLSKSMLNKIDEPYFSKGEPFFSAFDIKPTGIQSDKFLLEGNLSANDIIPAAGDNRWIDHMNNLSEKGLLENMDFGILQKDPALRNLENFNIYKKDWLKGYKEVPKPTSKFNSEIDWAKWNKEIPENSQLMKEYNAIEQTSKANGSWMKNPDGSAFQGTPEQFVQQNSENFKKAFGNSKLVNPDGSPTIQYHGSAKKFDTFDESKFQLGDSGYSGKGIYTSPSKTTANSYAVSSAKFHKGDIEPTVYELYGQANNPISSSQLINENKGRDLFNFHRDRNWQGELSPYESLREYDAAISDQLTGVQNIRPWYDAREVVFPTNKQLKSAIGNNGMFDMTNPNIYKALVPAAIGAGVLEQKKEGGVVKDDMGYWNPDNHGKVVEIDSNDITMEGVDQPLIGISDEGDQQYMLPGKNYKFKGKKVREYPVAKNGVRQEQKGLINLDDLTNFTNYNIPKAQDGDVMGKGKLQTRSGETMTFDQASQILKTSLGPMVSEKIGYLKSPLYKERLVGMGEKDPNKVIADRIKGLRKIKFSSYDPRMNVNLKESEPSETKKLWKSDKEGKAISSYPSISLGVGWKPSSAAHEIGHVTSSLIDDFVPTVNTGTGQTMSPREAREFLDLSKLKPEFKKGAVDLYNEQVRNQLSNPYGAIYDTDLGATYGRAKKIDEHSIGSGEAKGDLDAVRYLFKQHGLTKKYGENITPETLKKAQENKKIQGDEFFKRLKKRFSDEDIIKLNNEIAKNDVNLQESSYAKLGTKLKTKGWLDKY